MDPVRLDLVRQVAAITASLDGARPAAIARDLDRVSAIARANGLLAAAAVAPLIGLALAAGGQRSVARGWLAILTDAIGSERHDPEAARAFAGACSVRLAV
jgi:hypothetical protein